MKEGSLEHRFFRATLVYVLLILVYGVVYRIYEQQYATVIGYVIGWIISFLALRMSKRAEQARKFVMPWIIAMYGFGIFLWFKTGGLDGSGLIFFTISLALTIISPKEKRTAFVFLFGLTQIALVMMDEYFKHLPLWGDNTKSAWDFILLTTVNLSLVWILKTNYDEKEEKINQFSQGLRELHRLNLTKESNLDDVLTDYLNSGCELFNMQTGMIVYFDGEIPKIRNIGKFKVSEFVEEHLSLNEYLVSQVYAQGQTLYTAGGNSNFEKKNVPATTSKFFIACPLFVNNEKYGVLMFAADESKRSRFEAYDVEIMELMAINISHLLDVKVWSEYQEKTDQELHLSEKRFKTIYDYANVGICVCDRKGMVLMANRALQDLLEYTEAELIGESFYSISDSGDLTEMGEDIKQYEKIVLGEIDHYIIEKKNRTKTGKEIVINKTVSTVRDENEKVRFTVMIVDDITNRKINENKISALNDQLAIQVDKMDIANKELEAFSYSVSHDLRAPLRAIDGFSKIILEDHKDEFSDESRRLLNVIIKNSGKMAMLIDDLLMFSRITRKTMELKPIDLNELVAAVIEEQDLDQTIFEIGKLPKAKGEPTLMKQVFSNLIGNAVKFSSNEASPRIEIGAVENGKYYEYFVKDNGVGFNMAYYDKIFGVFQRLHTDDEFKGTGVGLAIAQKVIMKHNGKIWAESEEGKGTTFYFSLPK